MSLGPTEMMVILVVGLLVFGRRLPEVGRQMGKTFVEFRKSLHSFKEDLNVDGDLRETRETMRELQREVTRPVEIEPWERPSPHETSEEAVEDLDAEPGADQGGEKTAAQEDHLDSSEALEEEERRREFDETLGEAGQDPGAPLEGPQDDPSAESASENERPDGDR